MQVGMTLPVMEPDLDAATLPDALQFFKTYYSPANAVMAGAFANQNGKVLSDRFGRKPTDGELYIAHFLGAAGSVRLIGGAPGVVGP